MGNFIVLFGLPKNIAEIKTFGVLQHLFHSRILICYLNSQLPSTRGNSLQYLRLVLTTQFFTPTSTREITDPPTLLRIFHRGVQPNTVLRMRMRKPNSKQKNLRRENGRKGEKHRGNIKKRRVLKDLISKLNKLCLDLSRNLNSCFCINVKLNLLNVRD